MEAVIVYLSSISFFRQMSREEMEGVGSSFKLHSLGANQPLFEKGDPVESLWVVLSGRVALQPRAESMTAASPKARLLFSQPPVARVQAESLVRQENQRSRGRVRAAIHREQRRLYREGRFGGRASVREQPCC